MNDECTARLRSCDYATQERWLITCATLAIGVVLLAGEPVRGNVFHKNATISGSWHSSISSAPLSLSAPPAIANPKLCLAAAVHPFPSTDFPQVIFRTIMRAARTKPGSLHGP